LKFVGANQERSRPRLLHSCLGVAGVRQRRAHLFGGDVLAEFERELRTGAKFDARLELEQRQCRNADDHQHSREAEDPPALPREVGHRSTPGAPAARGAGAVRFCSSALKSQPIFASGVPTSIFRNVRVTVIAENMLTATPMASVRAKPFTV